MRIIETNFIRVSQQCISHYFCFISHLKQLSISNIAKQSTLVMKTGLTCVYILRYVLKEELAWVTNKGLLVISSVLIIKQLYQ